ncbi:MAG: trypsin-like peptidase domain-containing protein [Oscillospiraceae bacterium]|nr:trypsin-like peptidase domain-containing protein [Oscillospiraceae bacterium]
MSNPITVRLNPITPQSLDSFLRLRSSCINGERDVYFVRSLGTYAGLPQTVTRADLKMCSEMAEGRVLYLRPQPLSRAIPAEETAFYAEGYAAWSNGGSIRLRHSQDTAFLVQMDKAFREVLHIYRTSRPSVTDTMVRNYALKLCYWTDTVLQKVLVHWYASQNVKLIAVNFCKEQEYLFLYLAARLCCDVFLICTESDIEGTEALRSLSAAVSCGNFGKTEIPAFSVPVHQSAPVPAQTRSDNTPKLHIPQRPARQKSPVPAAAPQGNVRLKIPAHPDRHSAPPPVQPAVSRAPARPAFSRTAPPPVSRSMPDTERFEKSYEEIAAMAASVVMIGVIGSDGEIHGSGSGIMIGRNGYILTNFHVVREGRMYAVRIENEDKAYVTGQIIKYHADLDLAVIHIDKKLTPIPVYNGSKPLVRGQKVVAIGSPLGLFNSVSDGIISGFRTIDDVDMIQFTAPISHGSSGGAVLNIYGELIGISTAGIDSGQNINLAVGYESILPFARSFL